MLNGLRFWVIFGFRVETKPSARLSDDPLCQTKVDIKLTNLAREFGFWASAQEQITPSFHKGAMWTFGNPECDRTKKTVQKQVRKAKEKFWRAYDLAQDCGFVVLKSHGEYIRPRVKVLPDEKPASLVKVLPDSNPASRVKILD